MSVSTSIRRVVNSVLTVAILSGALGVFGAPGAQAQDAGERKVRIKVEPQYPEIARKMGLTGVVKLEIVVAPNGSVKETKVIGGHPILVNATVDAVKRWKFESASAESTESRDFKFEPGK